MIDGKIEMFAGNGGASDPMIATNLLPGDAEFVADAKASASAAYSALQEVLRLHEKSSVDAGLNSEFVVCKWCSDLSGDEYIIYPCATVKLLVNKMKEHQS
jgi:hypothetical protein